MADTKAAPTERRNWDKSEWEAKAKAKDDESAQYAKDAEKAMQQGKKPKRKMEDLPKATKKLEARTEDLGIEKNLNKTVLVQTTTTGKGPRGAGFYCDLCNRTLKDSLSYLDHVNGRLHLRRLGQTTQVDRSTLSQVRAKIASLRAATASKVTAKNFDFQKRLQAIRDEEAADKVRRKEEKKRKREERREEEEMRRMGITKRARGEGNGDGGAGGGGTGGGGVGGVPGSGRGADGKGESKRNRKAEREMKRERAKEDEEVDKAIQDNQDMAAMMGFGGFGTSKK